jgi:tetratricopeptide (TPR) repeat protein
MKCPKCGRTNGKTNKYCRECGIRLPIQDEPARSAAETDEVGVGEILFEVWEMLEVGDFDAALEKGEAMLEEVPESASAHSLVALIYERKGDRKLEQGKEDEARKLFKLAAAEYEKIIDLNPDSTADREKLASIRRKLAGEPEEAWLRPRVALKAAPKTVPRPLLAGFGAFILILILAIVFYPAKDERVAGAQPARSSTASGPVGAAVTPNAPKTPPQSPSALKVYTYRAAPQTGNPIPARAPKLESPAASKLSDNAKPSTRKPVKLPSFTGTELAVVPRTGAKSASATAAKAGKPPKTTEADTTPEKVEPATGGPNTGGKMLAQAIKLHDQGYTDEAIGAAQQAIALFQADVEAGRNVDSAKRGSENAKKLIKVWHQE